MNRILRTMVALSALLAAAPFVRPRTRGGAALLWVPKLLGGALAPIAGAIGAIAAVLGAARRDWRLAGAGAIGAGLAARLAADLPDVDEALAALPGSGGEGPAQGVARRAGHRRSAEFERNVVVGRNPESGRVLRADVWQPHDRPPSGLGLVYAHGSGWRLGDKDQLTRPFFRRLTAQGHVVLDVAYSLWPAAQVPEMVAEVNQAIAWLKENGPALGVRPDRVVVMGGSAGAHLALLAAYTPGHPAFRPAGAACDTKVRGVVAYYPPVDLLAMQSEAGSAPGSPGYIDRAGQAMLKRLFTIRRQDRDQEMVDDLVAETLGGTAAQIPATYRLLSPVYHVGPHCPPTLLVQGSDDVFGLAPGVRRLHDCLRAAGVPAVLLEFPHTEHGFDLLLPDLSPTARTATRGVVRFLARLE